MRVANPSELDNLLWFFAQGTGYTGPDDCDTETRDIQTLTEADKDVYFTATNQTWRYISEEEYNNFLAEYRAAVYYDPTYIAPGVVLANYLGDNHNLNLSPEQIAFLFLYDPWGAKMYLTSKGFYSGNQELSKTVFQILYGREPKYFSCIDGTWTETPSWTTAWYYNEADAYLTLVDVPSTLVDLVTIGLISALILIGYAELMLFIEGVEIFGFRNAINMWTSGTLQSSVNFMNSATNSFDMADDIVTLEAGTWQKGWLERGDIIDDALGNSLGHNFPVIDKLEGEVAVSIKSLDTAAATYQKGSALLSKLKSFTNQLYNFQGTTYYGVPVYQDQQFTSKCLELVIPDIQLSAAQMQAIIDAKAYAQSLDIAFKLIVGR